jgi:hypothetical protein
MHIPTDLHSPIMVDNVTIPEERTRALIYAGKLLAELSNPHKTPGIPDSMCESAWHVLRHYPDKGYITS